MAKVDQVASEATAERAGTVDREGMAQVATAARAQSVMAALAVPEEKGALLEPEAKGAMAAMEGLLEQS
ncbi:MAG TPA: hypothetical protein VFR78_11230 [Pyrinomonadaceae bacterium]|nr:hypothetical protein [Pyrinomonadaceae bacterium]